jgi:hypothetical protein
MAEEFDLLVDVPAFPAYALPPDAFPGFSAGSYGGSGSASGIASVEYLYRPDYEPRGRVLGVSNTRPEGGNELLREDPSWWASPKVRIGEIITGPFPVEVAEVAGVGARYLGEARADVDDHPCRLQRWVTLPEHALEDSLSAVRVRVDDAWVTLSSSSYAIEELERLVPRLKRVDAELLGRLRAAFADWTRKFEERRRDPGAGPQST